MIFENTWRVVWLLMAGVLLLPGSALAGSAWSTVEIEQWQSAVSPGGGDMLQRATAITSTQLGDQAEASSQSIGHQWVWFAGEAQQSQVVTAGSGLSWEDDTWPAQAVAETAGGVSQFQSAWSSEPVKSLQVGKLDQHSRVNESEAEAQAVAEHRTAGIVGDFENGQTLVGSTHAEGFVDPPVPNCTLCGSFGGSLLQRVVVVVENLFQF